MYITLVRFLLELSKEYKQWDCFCLANYLNRQALIQTFEKRNLPLSDGRDEDNFEKKYTFDWVKHAYAHPLRVKPEPAVSKSSAVGTPAASAAGGPPMIFDVEKGCLVPFE